MPKERIPEIERLRGIAFLAVVLQHSIAHYTIAPGMETGDGKMMAFLLLATKFAVPAFVFITGLVLFYNDSPQLNYRTFVVRRIKDIYIPFAIWTIIHTAVNQGLHLGTQEGWVELGRNLITGKSSSHLWYIIMLFQLYLLYPLIRKALTRIASTLSRGINIMLLIAAGGLFILLTDFVPEISVWAGRLSIPVFSDLFTTYADRNALYFSFYFIMGAAAGLNLQGWREWLDKTRLIYWPLFLFMFGFHLIAAFREVQGGDGTRITLHSLSLIRPWMALFLILSMLVMYDISAWICRWAGQSVNRLLSTLGVYSFGAYLVHLLTLRISYMADEAWLLSTPSWVRILSSWVISAALAYAVTRVISLLPFGKWIVGATGAKRRKSKPVTKPETTSADA